MKARFTTLDIIAVLRELREKVIGMRVTNVYDVDHKTYLIKLSRSEEKLFVMFESGVRMHLTEFEWPKNMMPSGFSMKCRKHLKSRRLVSITQLGVDRIVDMQFGSDEAAYHLIIELYDKGNVILTDYQYVVLSLLRTRTDAEAETRFAVREVYPKDAVRKSEPLPSDSRLKEILSSCSANDQLRKVLMPHFVYGAALLTHALIGAGFDEGVLVGDSVEMLSRLQKALEEAEGIFQQLSVSEHQSCITQRRQSHDASIHEDGAVAAESSDLIIYVEFHPMIFRQHEKALFTTYPSFNKAVDEFFSKLNSQKIDVKLHQQEKAGLKKLENVRKDHARRLQELERAQSEDCNKAELIELNIDLVTKACDIVNGAIASAMDWGDIVAMVKEARSHGDPVACAIRELQLEKNHIILSLCNPYDFDDDDGRVQKGTKVDIDLDLTAHANSRRYYDHKRYAVGKQKKTIDASSKALKSAEKKTRQALKEASKVATIKKARKVHWFEKFYWFISSQNYLIIGGRDQQQNELIVKRYLTDGDLYVHADLHGASSVVIKNPSKELVPARTLSEAATMATCYSSAWEAKVTSSVWWVWHHQVSKTAPSGEYLTTGSFMIRGKKNYIPPTQLMLCFGFMFKLDEFSIANHHNERRVKGDDDSVSMASEEADVAMDLDVLSSSSDGEDTEPAGLSVDDVLVATFPDTIIGLSGSHDYRPSNQLMHPHKAGSGQDEDKKLSRKIDDKGNSGQQFSASQTSKRGQKFKQRKMKERYKDQDDEDRQLRMQLLASAGDARVQVTGKGKKKNDKKHRNISNNPKHKYYHSVTHHNKESSSLLEVTNKQQDPVVVAHVMSPDPKLEVTNKQQDPVVVAHVMSPDPKLVHVMPSKISEQDVKLSMDLEHQNSEKDHVTSVMKSEQDDALSYQDHVTSVPHHHASQDILSSQECPECDQGSSKQCIDQGTDQDGEQAIVQESHLHNEKERSSDQDRDQSDQEDDNKDDTTLLDTLTGCPSEDDILLFAVPVCAPYMAMTQYKYKVKIIPGMQRRGKAARTAVHNFIHSKEVCSHERDLLLSVKDNDLSRYFPGKVKMLATNTSTATKSRHK